MAKGGANFYITVDFDFIPQIVAQVEMTSRGAPKKIADKIEKTAKGLAPVKTGFLRNNIEAVSLKRGKTAEVISYAKYSAFQEYGTARGIVPKYFMTRAFQQHANELGGVLMDSVYPW